MTSRSKDRHRLPTHRIAGRVLAIALPVMALGVVWGLLAGEAQAAAPLRMSVLDTTGHLVEGALSCVDSLTWSGLRVLGVQGEHPSADCSGLRGIGFAFLGLAALVTIALGRMRLQTEHKRLELAQRFVEQGLEPPGGLLMGPARDDLRKGLVLMFAGAGLFVAGMFTGDRGLAAGGLVPEFIGIGYLVSFWLAGRSLDAGDEGR